MVDYLMRQNLKTHVIDKESQTYDRSLSRLFLHSFLLLLPPFSPPSSLSFSFFSLLSFFSLDLQLAFTSSLIENLISSSIPIPPPPPQLLNPRATPQKPTQSLRTPPFPLFTRRPTFLLLPLFSLFDKKRDGDDKILLVKGEVGGVGEWGEEDVVAWYHTSTRTYSRPCIL